MELDRLFHTRIHTNIPWRVVAQIDIPGRKECLRFANVPLLDPAHVAIISDGSSRGSADANSLFDALVTAIRDLSNPAENPTTCTGPTGLACMARKEPSCYSILIAVGDGSTPFQQSQLLTNWTTVRPRRSVVLPIVPHGSKPNVVLPAGVSTKQSLLLAGPISGAVPDILRAARIGIDEFRLFISYRREDSQVLAEQLYDALSRVGFRTYLDRFHGTLGRAFPTQIAEELINAGCVLVLESPNVLNSPWTLAEVAFAHLYRLGLLALEMPSAKRLRGINPRDRLTLPNKWKLGAQATLIPPADEEVVAFVRNAYAQQLLRRRVYLENTLRQALFREGLTSAHGEGGIAVVDSLTRTGIPQKRYGLLPTRRPPRVHHMRRVLLDKSAMDCRILVGPKGFLSPEDREDTSWTAEKVGVRIENEFNLRSLVTRLANGAL